MCGITFTTEPSRGDIEHRGPDSTSIKSFNFGIHRITMIFNRLSITGVSNGEQPFYSDGVYLMCNGEIYNYKKIQRDYELKTTTQSDCEVILRLYLQGGIDMLNCIQGEYAFVLFDTRSGLVIFSRDQLGVRPLFISKANSHFSLSSELKGLPSKRGFQVRPNVYHIYDLFSEESTEIPIIRYGNNNVKKSLINAVRTRLNSEVPIGFLLSGGLDSSLVLSIASRFITDKITVFTTGFSHDAPDVVNAKKVIEYLTKIYGDKYIHHIYIPTIQEGIDSIPSVIKSIESYDTTTVRASTPMWMLARYIRQKTNVKVVLSGEGSDEINGSYLYFHYAPNQIEFDEERRILTDNIHFFDGLRADRTISAFGLELRTPFLDSSVVIDTLNEDVYTSMKETGIEKYTLRNKFRDYLPPELLWRTKAAFSDAVSYSWKESLQKYSEELLHGAETRPEEYLPSRSCEERWYRLIFDTFYPDNERVIPYKWLPRWVDTKGEPSATALAIHQERNCETSPA